MLLILSAPITTTFLNRPLSIYMAPVVSAYKKPEQAALRSNPQAFLAPILSQTMLAVAGNSISAVTVATIKQSISSGLMPLFLQISSATGTQRSEVALPGSFRILLSSMPVRVRIHSSLVSTIFSRSAFVKLSSGTYPPIAVMAAVIFSLIMISNQVKKIFLAKVGKKVRRTILIFAGMIAFLR